MTAAVVLFLVNLLSPVCYSNHRELFSVWRPIDSQFLAVKLALLCTLSGIGLLWFATPTKNMLLFCTCAAIVGAYVLLLTVFVLEGIVGVGTFCGRDRRGDVFGGRWGSSE